VDQAVQGYTLTPAAASGIGDVTGSLSLGKKADLIVTDRNIFTVDSKEIPATRVVLTLFNGKVVYERP
jgi:hypothetical protein